MNTNARVDTNGHPLVSTCPLVSTSTLTVATAAVSVYRVMFTLSGDNVQYQPLLSTFNEKTKIKKFEQNTFSDMTKQTILSSHRAKTRDILDIRLV